MGLLQNKAAIVTGAGSGLGEETAIAFAREGANVVVCGRRTDRLEQTVRRITDTGGTAAAVQADVTKEADVRRVVQAAIERFGSVDILVNNAAVLKVGLVYETKLEDWEDQLRANLTGPFLMTREVLAPMRAKHSGCIINITSALAANGAGGYAAYSASKAGLESLTRTTAEEESRNRIVVNLFDPGTVRSSMHATGRHPAAVAPEIVRLAARADIGFTGRLVVCGTI